MLSRQDYKPKSKFLKDLMAEGHAKGRAEGRAEGHAEGRAVLAKTLRELLAKRHLSLRAPYEAKIAKATSAQLTRWILKAADAKKITDVFPNRR